MHEPTLVTSCDVVVVGGLLPLLTVQPGPPRRTPPSSRSSPGRRIRCSPPQLPRPRFPRCPPSGVPSAGGRRFPGILDVLNLKKRGGGARSCIRVEVATGSVQTIEVGKAPMMRRYELPARELRLLDPLVVYPYTILDRERAIIVNLEQIRCVIAADEVLLLNSVDIYFFQYAVELPRRLLKRADGDELPLSSDRSSSPSRPLAPSSMPRYPSRLHKFGIPSAHISSSLSHWPAPPCLRALSVFSHACGS